MLEEKNKAIVRRFIEEMDSDLSVIDVFCAPDSIAHLPGSPAPTDRQGFKTFAALLYAAIPDLRHEVDDQIAEGDKVVSRVSVRGTHRGPLLWIAPTNREVCFTDLIIIRLEDGKAVELWAQFDFLSILTQSNSELFDGSGREK